MFTIAIVNEKGGTGKTTTAVSLTAALGEQQQKVLLVDLDGQAASSRWLGVEDDTSFAEALSVGKGLKPLRDLLPNVSLAPASGKLDAVAHDLRPTQGGQLRRLLAEVADEFQFCIIDCPPSLGNRLIGNALLAATHAIVPVETSILALDGLKILLTTLEDVREGLGHEVILAGVLACRFDARTRLSHMVLAELNRALPGKVFTTLIRENVRMRECPASGQSILTYASDSHAAKDYRSLAKELLSSPMFQADAVADAAGENHAEMAERSTQIGAGLRQSVRKMASDESSQRDWIEKLDKAKEVLTTQAPSADEPASAGPLPSDNEDAAPAATLASDAVAAADTVIPTANEEAASPLAKPALVDAAADDTTNADTANADSVSADSARVLPAVAESAPVAIESPQAQPQPQQAACADVSNWQPEAIQEFGSIDHEHSRQGRCDSDPAASALSPGLEQAAPDAAPAATAGTNSPVEPQLHPGTLALMEQLAGVGSATVPPTPVDSPAPLPVAEITPATATSPGAAAELPPEVMWAPPAAAQALASEQAEHVLRSVHNVEIPPPADTGLPLLSPEVPAGLDVLPPLAPLAHEEALSDPQFSPQPSGPADLTFTLDDQTTRPAAAPSPQDYPHLRKCLEELQAKQPAQKPQQQQHNPPKRGLLRRLFPGK